MTTTTFEEFRIIAKKYQFFFYVKVAHPRATLKCHRACASPQQRLFTAATHNENENVERRKSNGCHLSDPDEAGRLHIPRHCSEGHLSADYATAPSLGSLVSLKKQRAPRLHGQIAEPRDFEQEGAPLRLELQSNNIRLQYSALSHSSRQSADGSRNPLETLDYDVPGPTAVQCQVMRSACRPDMLCQNA